MKNIKRKNCLCASPFSVLSYDETCHLDVSMRRWCRCVYDNLNNNVLRRCVYLVL